MTDPKPAANSSTQRSLDSFGSRATVTLAGKSYDVFRLDALTRASVGDVATLPFSIKILLENLLRREDGKSVFAEHIKAVAAWDPKVEPSQEIQFTPARALLQDFTGVPAVCDLAAMREALARLGGDPTKINPLQPAELVIDHSVQVDHFGTLRSFDDNVKLEFSATKSAISSCAGARTPSRASASSRPARASSTRSTSSTSPASSSRAARAARRSRTPTRSSAPTRTPR